MKIAVLGTGKVGEVLANGFLKHGHDVMRGSRDPGKLARVEDRRRTAGRRPARSPMPRSGARSRAGR